MSRFFSSCIHTWGSCNALAQRVFLIWSPFLTSEMALYIVHRVARKRTTSATGGGGQQKCFTSAKHQACFHILMIKTMIATIPKLACIKSTPFYLI